MAEFTSYCEFVAPLDASHHHRSYHDTEYGFPITEESVLFERLCLEINQAGLTWDLILKRRPMFFEAFHGFEVDRVAALTEADVEGLLQNAGIIRNRKKIESVIANAQKIQVLRTEFGSFLGWIEAHHPRPKEEWVKLFKKTFKFTGGEIVNEFLMSLGYLPGSHIESCPKYREALEAGAKWRDVTP